MQGCFVFVFVLRFFDLPSSLPQREQNTPSSKRVLFFKPLWDYIENHHLSIHSHRLYLPKISHSLPTHLVIHM